MPRNFFTSADANLIRRALYQFKWEWSWTNLNVHDQAAVLNRTVIKVLHNYIPHETIILNDKDPPWFSKRIKSSMQKGIL